MPSRSDIVYFGAGPALLPTPVLEDAAGALVNYKDTGLGIAEHSHRSEHAANVLNETKADLIKYLDIPETHDVLFMQGGGTGQFAAVAYNLIGNWVHRQHEALVHIAGDDQKSIEVALKLAVKNELKVDYLVTGSWSDKAAKEAARLFGSEVVNVATDSRTSNENKFGTIAPEADWKLSNKPAYVYFCDNETVDGVEFPAFPKVLEPREDGPSPVVVADMSSNILSRRVPIANYGVIFFGAQKNLGAAGVTGVIIRKDLLPQAPVPLLRKLGLPIPPIVFSYEITAKNNSLYNTLPIFDIYICGKVLRRLLETYPDRAAGQEAISEQKANAIYSALAAHPETYRIIPAEPVRSRMNIVFRVTKGDDVDAAEKAFLKGAAERGLTGLKGHRSVGGMRASNYNSVDVEGAQKLVAFIEEFAKSA